MNLKKYLERELKFDGVELEALRERLLELEAERRRPSALEENWIFDRGSELRGSACLLRLRTDGHGGATLTYKGPARYEGRTRIRAERETGVNDAEALRAILESLGYNAVRRYQKVREEWQLGGVTICLDHTPIGDFAEFEGEGAETVARRCGFDPDMAERRSYLRLYEDHQRENPEAPPDMIFP